jgi:hypothetical protein
MPFLFSMYIPNPEHAVGPACIQFLLIAILAGALYAYLKPKRGRKATLIALIVGEAISLLPPLFAIPTGLGKSGDFYRSMGVNYADWAMILADHFLMYRFAIYSFICLLIAGFLVYVLKTDKVTGNTDSACEQSK